MRNLEFVHISTTEIGGDDAVVTFNADRRRIRSLVMKDFRRKERQQRATGLIQGEDVKDNTQSEPVPKKSQPLRLPPTVSAPPVWRHSFGSRMAEAWFPAGHRDSALRNIAYTYDMINSGPIILIQDALSLLHAGSDARIDRLMLEARKRYVPVIALLRLEVSKRTPDVPVAQLGFLAMACLMCEVR